MEQTLVSQISIEKGNVLTLEDMFKLIECSSETLERIILSSSDVSEELSKFGLEIQFINKIKYLIKLNNEEISFETFYENFSNNQLLTKFFLDLKILTPKLVFDSSSVNSMPKCIEVLNTFFFWELQTFPINTIKEIQNYILQKYKESQDSVKVFKNFVKKFKSIENIIVKKIFDFLNITTFLYSYQEFLFEDFEIIDVLQNIKEIKDNEFNTTIVFLKKFLYETIENRLIEWSTLSVAYNSVTNKYFHDTNLEYLTLIIVFGNEIENDFDFSGYSNIEKVGTKRIGLNNVTQLYGIINYSIIFSNFSLLKKIIFYNLILVKNKKNIRILILRNWSKLKNSGFFTNRELYAIVNNCSETEYESDSDSNSDSNSDSDSDSDSD